VVPNNRFDRDRDRDRDAVSIGKVRGRSMIKIRELRFVSRALRCGQPER
jgi:hypothetical protein